MSMQSFKEILLQVESGQAQSADGGAQVPSETPPLSNAAKLVSDPSGPPTFSEAIVLES